MPTDEMLDEMLGDEIDRALRDLLPPMPGDRPWERAQRDRLVTFIEQRSNSTPPASPSRATPLDRVAPNAERRRPPLLALAASVIAVVAAGLVVVSRSRDEGAPASDPDSLPAAQPDPTVAAVPEPSSASPSLVEQVRVPPLEGLTEGQARQVIEAAGLTIRVGYRELVPGDSTDGTVVESPAAGESVDLGSIVAVIVGVAQPATTSALPDVFPVLAADDPRAAGATATYGGQVAFENVASATALVARDDGAAATEGIELTVAAQLDPAFYEMATEQQSLAVAGQPMLLFVEGQLQTLVQDGEPALIARGLDPVGFIEAAGGFPVEGAVVGDDGEVSFTVGALPAGYSIISVPARLPRGSINAMTKVGVDQGGAIWATVDVIDPRPVYGSGGPLVRTAVNGVEAWANGATLMWKVSDITWVTITGAESLDQALEVGGSLDFVDEATWTTRFGVERHEFAVGEGARSTIAPSG